MKKLLLKGTLTLALAVVAVSCTTKATSNETKEESCYESNRNTFFGTDIRHQLQVFTAGKVWLERTETASILAVF